MNINHLHNIYFIGIGGIGMSALARYFVAHGKNVAGYDKTKTEITNQLVQVNVKIHFKDSVALIDNAFLNPKTTLIVYTPAVPNTHTELNYFISHDFKVYKRAQVLAEITKDTFCFAIAGTHGKTTTTSILGHLLKECHVEMTAFLGGISENYNSNLILNGNAVTVVEADEFDRSFLTLSPDFAAITSMDADHLDIYKDEKSIKDSFIKFSKRLMPKGKLFVNKGLPIEGITYATNEKADYHIINLNIINGSYVFDMVTPNQIIKKMMFSLPGKHNLSNALLALAMALEYGCSAKLLIKALSNYKGVKRRFSYQIKSDDLIFIDDYAHHPTEIYAVYDALKEMYPQDAFLVIFQPHLYTRTRDFANEFAISLSAFNEILLLDIYPARELPIAGITSSWLLNKVNNTNKKLIAKKDIVSEILKSNCRVIITLGAGDIGQEVEHIKKQLKIAS